MIDFKFQFEIKVFMINSQNLLVVLDGDGDDINLCDSSITPKSCFNDKLEQIDDFVFTSHISSTVNTLIWFTEK